MTREQAIDTLERWANGTSTMFYSRSMLLEMLAALRPASLPLPDGEGFDLNDLLILHAEIDDRIQDGEAAGVSLAQMFATVALRDKLTRRIVALKSVPAPPSPAGGQEGKSHPCYECGGKGEVLEMNEDDDGGCHWIPCSTCRPMLPSPSPPAGTAGEPEVEFLHWLTQYDGDFSGDSCATIAAKAAELFGAENASLRAVVEAIGEREKAEAALQEAEVKGVGVCQAFDAKCQANKKYDAALAACRTSYPK